MESIIVVDIAIEKNSMKNLTLIRHAETQPQQIFESDQDRALTQIGHHQAVNISIQLKEKKCLPDFILSSPAKRAKQTAQFICENLKLAPKLININPALYFGSIEDILQTIFLMDSSKQIFLIGHNPMISGLAHKLCPSTKSIILPTAGVISLNFNIAKWSDLSAKQGKLLFFIEPQHE